MCVCLCLCSCVFCCVLREDCSSCICCLFVFVSKFVLCVCVCCCVLQEDCSLCECTLYVCVCKFVLCVPGTISPQLCAAGRVFLVCMLSVCVRV